MEVIQTQDSYVLMRGSEVVAKAQSRGSIWLVHVSGTSRCVKVKSAKAALDYLHQIRRYLSSKIPVEYSIKSTDASVTRTKEQELQQGLQGALSSRDYADQMEDLDALCEWDTVINVYQTELAKIKNSYN